MDYELILKDLGYALPLQNLRLDPMAVTGNTTVLSVTDTTTGENSTYVVGKIRGVVLLSGSPLIPTLNDNTHPTITAQKTPTPTKAEISTEAEVVTPVEEDINTEEESSTQEDTKVDSSTEEDTEEESSTEEDTPTIPNIMEDTPERLNYSITTHFIVIPDGQHTPVIVPSNSDISTMNGGALAMKIKSIRKTYGETARIMNSCVPDKYR